jgi:D-glycero-D-manno-heptose 1,7-bisphosphate phosphatase
MLLRAAADLNLDLTASWMVGDMISDVWAGLNAGCRSILLEPAEAPLEDVKALEGRALILPDLSAAAAAVLTDRGEHQ